MEKKMHVELLWTPKPRLTPKESWTATHTKTDTTIWWTIMSQYHGGYFFFRGDEAVEWIEDAGYPVQSCHPALSDLCNLQLIERLGPGRYRFLREVEAEELVEMVHALKEVRREERAKALANRH